MTVDFGKAPPAGPVVTQFHATPAELPPMHPQRLAAIRHLVDHSFTASGQHQATIAQHLKNLNPSPDEIRYIAGYSARAGDAAVSARAHADMHDLTHTVLPNLANAALGIVGTDIHHVSYAVQHPIARVEEKGPFQSTGHAATVDGKHVAMSGSVGFPWPMGGAGALEEVAGAGRTAEHVPRYVKLGGKAEGGAPLRAGEHGPVHPSAGMEAQFPLSPATVTGWAQRHLDRLSERLVAPATTLSESESPAARAAGKVVTKASARARVPIQAGKNLRQEARRATSLRADEVKTLTPSLLHGDSGSQLAHFWWAQLPARLRNVEGLKVVRGKLAEERASLAAEATAPRASAGPSPALEGARAKVLRLEKQVETAELKQSGGNLIPRYMGGEGDTPQVAALRALHSSAKEDVARLEAVAAGAARRAPSKTLVRQRLEDLRSADANLAKLDKVIAKPPAFQPHVIDAARTLMNDREQALVAAGKLDPQGATARKGLVSRWLGIEPTGEEVYLGHRLTEQPSGVMPRGGGLGGTKLPAGVGKENRMVLASTGRVRQSMQTAIEDWQRSQAYHFTTTAKDELAKMGEPIGPEGPKEGHLVVNPQGHTLPRVWKMDEAGRAAAEGITPEDATVHDLEEYARNTLAGGADRTRLIEAAQQAGHAEDLRQIPADVARRYFAQFVPHRVVAGTVPGVVKAASVGKKTADLAHDLVYASLIYSNPGYIPANTVANLVMAGLHQGAFLPANLIRSGQAYFASGSKLRNLLGAEVGMGATRTAASEGRYPGSKVMDFAVGKVAGIPDNVPRISSFLHEAAREGIISKVSPILTKRDQAALENLLTNPAKRPLLNDIRDRSVQAMVDFERLGAHEKAIAKRLFFVWSWTRGATRYPARFALDHPVRSLALGYAAAGAPGAPQEVRDKVKEYTPTVAKGMPSWLQEAINVGTQKVGGKSFPSILPTSSISPMSTPLQVARTAKDLVDGSPAQGAQTLGDYINPALVAGYHVATKTSTFGQHESYGAALKEQALRMSPGANLIKGELHPKAGGIYPEDATRLGRFKRSLRVFPIAVDPEQAYKARVREGTVPQSEKDAHTRATDLAKLNTQLTDLGGHVPSEWQKAARTAQATATARDIAEATAQRALPKGQLLPARTKYEIVLKVLRDHKMLTPAQYKAGLSKSKNMTDRQLDHWRGYAWRTFGFGDAGGPGAILAAVHHAHNQLPAIKNKKTKTP